MRLYRDNMQLGRNVTVARFSEVGIRIAIVFLLCVATIVISVEIDPYESTGPNLLRNPDFTADLICWTASSGNLPGTVTSRDGVLTLSTGSSLVPLTIELRQAFTPGYDRLLSLTGEIRTVNVIPGKRAWETARVLLTPIYPTGNFRYDVPHLLASQEGSLPWTKFTQTFRIPDENTEAVVAIQVLNAMGTLEVRSLSLHASRESSGFVIWRGILIATWLAVAPWVTWPLMRAAKKRPGGILVIGVAAIILLGVLIPISVKYQLTPSWLLPESEAPGPFRADLVASAVPFRFDVIADGAEAYKAAHFLFFAVIGWVLRTLRPFNFSLPTQFWIVVLFALATEAAQTLAAGRGGSLGDVFVDSAGVMVGMLVARTHVAWSRKVAR
jgi:hypothetical protein